MRTLYLDTSSSYLYLGVVEDNHLVFSLKEKLATDLSKFALLKMAEMFDECHLDPKSINKIVLVNGPGSFTGVRIGITIAKTYAWGLNIPIVTLSSLKAMAISCPKTEEVDYIVPMIDARRNAVYAGIYNNKNEVILKDQYVKLETLQVAIEELSGNFVIVTNDVFEGLNTIPYDPDILAIVQMTQDLPCENPHAIDANYLKLTEAEEKMME